ncbi:MAG: bifunctional 5,10-methylenetetrahydrofolate dehydrogenase/5,10-methenyltetrahydrofolate cyclohydrolase [Candidatus Dojkabacteria bacterium]
MKVIDGRLISKGILDAAAKKITKHKVTPRLDIVFVGSNLASKVYVNQKRKTGEEYGVEVRVHELKNSTPDALASFVTELDSDRYVNGIIIQLPVPDFYPSVAMAAISPEKDVDGLNPLSLGRLWQKYEDVLIPATPGAVVKALEFIATESQKGLKEYLTGKNILIINRSDILGKPLAALLLNNDCTTTLAHSKTCDLDKHTSQADVVITATGQPGIISGEMLKKGSIVIDAGFSKTGKSISGDVDPNAVEGVAEWLSPVPGGIGPLGVAMLISNTVDAAVGQLTL